MKKKLSNTTYSLGGIYILNDKFCRLKLKGNQPVNRRNVDKYQHINEISQILVFKKETSDLKS